MAETECRADGGHGERQRSPGRKAVTLYVLCTVPFIMVLGNSLLIPVLPELQKALDTNLTRVGVLITLFSIPAGLIIPFSGFISDRSGRRAVIAPALALYGTGGLVAGVAAVLAANPWPWIVAGRILQGVGAGGTYQLAMAMASDIYTGPARAWALGLLEAANGLGKVIAPLAGAAAALLAWYAPFFLYGVLALPAAALVWWVAEEPKLDEKPQSLHEYGRTLAQIARQKGVYFLITSMAGFLVLGNLFGTLSLLSDMLERDQGIGVFGRGLLLAIPVLLMASVAYTTGTIMQKQLPRYVGLTIPLGLGLAAAGIVALLLLDHWILRLAAVSLGTGVGTGLTLPSINVLITSTASRAERGIVTGIYGSLRFFGVAAGPPFYGWGADTGRLLLLLAVAGVLGVVALLQLFVVREEELLPAKLTGPAPEVSGQMGSSGGKQLHQNGGQSRSHQWSGGNPSQEGNAHHRADHQADHDDRIGLK
ncbi:MAG: MFS transporter [Limnochordales bacterium]|nr:MFS transporter [Limnochordales bacterium]